MEKKLIKCIINIPIFIAIINLPFITMAQLIGIDTFSDSFEKPEFYQYSKSTKIDHQNFYH